MCIEYVGFVMSNVRLIEPRDRVLYDAEAIASLYRNLGHHIAERMVSRAFAALSDSLAFAEVLVKGHDFPSLQAKLVEIRMSADNLGLTTLAFVAEHARENLQRDPHHGQTAAFSALWARLKRVAEASMNIGYGAEEESLDFFS